MTEFTSNIDELIQKFKLISERARQVDIVTALEAGVNAARGQMSDRIFTRGEDADGNSLGAYVGSKQRPRGRTEKKLFGKKGARQFLAGSQTKFSPYEKKRIEAGRQVRKKDFEFEGALRRGIVVLRDGTLKVICAIPNQDLLKIARGLEEQTGRILGTGKLKVFSLSSSEREFMIDNTNEALKQLYDRIINSQ